MPRSSATEAALMRFTPSACPRIPSIALLRIRSVLPSRDATVVGEVDALEAALGELCQKTSQPVGKSHVRRQFQILLVRKRGQIDCILHHAELQILAYLQRDLHADGLLCFGGRPSDVRREDHILQFEERRILERLLVENVQGRTANVTALERLGQRFFDNQLAARTVYDAHSLLHRCERCLR